MEDKEYAKALGYEISSMLVIGEPYEASASLYHKSDIVQEIGTFTASTEESAIKKAVQYLKKYKVKEKK